jgi:MoCo/4Fe-4S cofactor protein with predicted Tat translocation signal
MSPMNSKKGIPSRLGDSRQPLAAASGKQFWRSLEELAQNEAFQASLGSSLPQDCSRQATMGGDPLSRRKFLALMGASLALAGVSGCSVKPAPSVEIVPYVRPPEEVVPGRSLFFATTMTVGRTAVGLLVQSHMGRPTKIEGNPDHPASLGATDPFSQASVLTLYHPDRSQTATFLGQARTWGEAGDALGKAMQQQRQSGGKGLRLLSESVISPTLSRQLHDLLKQFPAAKWHVWEPLHRDTAYQGAQMAFGQPVDMLYDFTKADVVLALDADFLGCHPGNLHDVADFMSRRRVRTTEKESKQAAMNRLYVVETAVTCTGAKADHRLAIRSRDIEGMARAIAGQMGFGAGGNADETYKRHKPWVDAVSQDLQQHRGRSLVLAGEAQPAIVHLLAHALNEHLGNVGQTIKYIDPIEARPLPRTPSLRELVDDMEQGTVELLVILGGNPAYNAPADIPFVEQMQKVPLRVHLSLYQDETSLQCHWHLPEAHYLEAWSDANAFDGTASIAQPLIEPLYGGRSSHEVLVMLTEQREMPGREIVRAYWQEQWKKRQKAAEKNKETGEKGKDRDLAEEEATDKQATDKQATADESQFEAFWQTALHDGLIADTAASPKTVPLKTDWQRHLQAGENSANTVEAAASAASEPSGLEIVFQPDPTIYDGRFANNGWLQELPKPITRTTWENAAIMSPRTAQQLHIELGSYSHGGEHGGYYMPLVQLLLDGRTVRGPAWIMPGHADGSITVNLGYGRRNAGRVGGNVQQPVGFDAYALRTANRPWFAPGLKAIKLEESYLVACTQAHHSMEKRDVVRAGTLDEYRQTPRFATEPDKEREKEETTLAPLPTTLYRPFDYAPPKHKWGMVIDLTTCVGCQACVAACQAENNIPVVGKEQVAAGREMHWLRIDRYIHGTPESPDEFYFQPLPCMHCEQAPCEYVCPTEATVHSAEGLNDMVFNRCVGTRFCSNNCPYKVRRFNFFFYADYNTSSLRLQYNPDVTVRSRGVMEKCSYCVQRIRHAEIDTEADQRRLVDGEVLTACQAACPAQAIVFGDLNDPQSTVKQWKGSPLHYALLAELNTEPRTTYLAALRNPNPDLEAPQHGQ